MIVNKCSENLLTKSKKLYENYRDNCTVVQRMLEKYKKIYPNISDYSIMHFIDIAEFCDLIMDRQKLEDLNGDECYCLLMAALFAHTGFGLNQEIMNKERGIMRKISSLKSFYNYFYRNERIKNNPAALVRLPKIHEKEIIRLDIDEVALLLDEVEQGENLTEKQKAYHNKTKLRDLAIMTLLLGTGIRVSECVGLNIADIDFKNGGIRIYRKGGKEVTVYFGTEVEEALLDYLEERDRIIPETGSEDALFLSLQKKRMAVRSVENLVKKYARTVAPLKPITPHKLRSTYGTSLYRETGDIYLVADVLGHSDVNTTKRHYAALEDERRRSARNKVQLRESGGKK